MKEPALLKIRDVAETLQLSVGMIYKLIRQGKLKILKVGRTTRVRRKSVEDLINGRRTA